MSTIRLATALAIATLAACSSDNRPLPMVKADDPVSLLNPDRWHATVNDLMVPLGDGAPRPLPAPAGTGSNKVPGL